MSEEIGATNAAYLEAASRISFMGGLNRAVVDGKWPAFREAFHEFDVDRVASMTPADVERLSVDERLIRNRAKLAAVVDNAAAIAARAAENGTFGAYVESMLSADGLEATQAALAHEFAFISIEGAKHWLYATGHDVGVVSDKVRAKYGMPE